MPAPAAAANVEPPLDLARLLPSARSLLVGFGLLAAAAAAYALARETPLFALRSIEVRGAPPSTVAEIRGALRDRLGRSLVGLSGGSVIERVEALPDVVSATYDRDFPHTLRLVVRPEVPAVVLRRGHASWLVSTRGRVMRSVAPRTHGELPRVWLPRSGEVQIGGILDDALGGIPARALATVRGTPFARQVRGAVLSSREGLVVVLRSGVRIRFGSPVAVPLKLAVAERIAAVLPAGTTTLDVSVPERPVADSNPRVGG